MFNNLDDNLSRLTTIISFAKADQHGQGTGFFFQELTDKRTTGDGREQYKISNLWLVTNRHVILHKDNKGAEFLPDELEFCLRKRVGGNITWEPIHLSQAELKKRARFHPNPAIDIALVDVFDLVTSKIKSDTSIIQWHAVSELDFPKNKKINLEVTSDVVTVGYPFGYYDALNIFPIVKSGIIASRWKSKFNGNPYFFLIDSKLFPGSSGSIVISKPSNFIVHDGTSYGTREKEYAFIGIYSGEPYNLQEQIDTGDIIIVKKQRYDVAIVWYSDLVIDIIKSGLTLK